VKTCAKWQEKIEEEMARKDKRRNGTLIRAERD
jgi:hypothetical protein